MHGTPTLVTAFFPLQLVFTALFAALFLGQARATPPPATCHRRLTNYRRHVTTHTAPSAQAPSESEVGGGAMIVCGLVCVAAAKHIEQRRVAPATFNPLVVDDPDA